jgi:hypothetical protein
MAQATSLVAFNMNSSNPVSFGWLWTAAAQGVLLVLVHEETGHLLLINQVDAIYQVGGNDPTICMMLFPIFMFHVASTPPVFYYILQLSLQPRLLFTNLGRKVGFKRTLRKAGFIVGGIVNLFEQGKNPLFCDE